MSYLETNLPHKRKRTAIIVISIGLVLAVCAVVAFALVRCRESTSNTPAGFNYADVPVYSGCPIAEINENAPFFAPEEIVGSTFEIYSPLDSLGRCGPAEACLCAELMPTEEREGIGMIKPSGWHTVRYDDLIEDKYLYNRCHLIAYMLSGENANEDNLITGTRYFNISGMLPYENMVAEYIMTTGNHVLYRVTPVFVDRELLARGVLMEAYSVEDDGRGIQFNVFVYNVQPGIEIDYSTGESFRAN